MVSVKDALNQTTSYVYDAFGNMTQVTDAEVKVATASYDQRGRKVGVNDPDLGAWSYTYNTLDQLTRQTDAKAQTSSVSYDLLGRTTQRVESGLTSSWTYDTAAHGIGRLASASTDSGYQRTIATMRSACRSRFS